MIEVTPLQVAYDFKCILNIKYRARVKAEVKNVSAMIRFMRQTGIIESIFLSYHWALRRIKIVILLQACQQLSLVSFPTLVVHSPWVLLMLGFVEQKHILVRWYILLCDSCHFYDSPWSGNHLHQSCAIFDVPEDLFSVENCYQISMYLIR